MLGNWLTHASTLFLFLCHMKELKISRRQGFLFKKNIFTKAHKFMKKIFKDPSDQGLEQVFGGSINYVKIREIDDLPQTHEKIGKIKWRTIFMGHPLYSEPNLS